MLHQDMDVDLDLKVGADKDDDYLLSSPCPLAGKDQCCLRKAPQCHPATERAGFAPLRQDPTPWARRSPTGGATGSRPNTSVQDTGHSRDDATSAEHAAHC